MGLVPMKLKRHIGRPPPMAYETALRRALEAMLRQVRATIRAGGVETLGDVRALGAALREKWPDKRIRRIVEAVGKKAEASASRPWAPLERVRARAAARGDVKEYDGPALVARWTREATARITSVRDEIAEGLRADVIAAAEKGQTSSELASKWLAEGIPVEWGTAEGRLRTIAQNQLTTLHAQVQSERARAVGVVDIVWRTQGDAKVRPAHRALEGTRHEYTNPPAEGLPGVPVNCRCWAESVIPDELAAEIGFEIEG